MMKMALDRAKADAARVDADWRLSDEGRAEKRAVVTRGARETVQTFASLLWGDPSSSGLVGGAVWSALDKARGRLREARDVADSMDPARLSLAYQRVPGIVAGMRNADQVAAWYINATAIEQRALQDVGGGVLRQRFSGDAGLGGLLAGLEHDRVDALRTPDVIKAEQGVAEAEHEALEAWKAVNGAAATWGIGGQWGPLHGILSGVQITRVVENIETDPVEHITFSNGGAVDAL